MKAYLTSENITEADRIAGFKIYPVAEATNLEEKLKWLRKQRFNLFSGQ